MTEKTKKRLIEVQKLPDIPKSWVIIVLAGMLAFLRYEGIDSYITAGIATLIGYQTGRHIAQSK